MLRRLDCCPRTHRGQSCGPQLFPWALCIIVLHQNIYILFWQWTQNLVSDPAASRRKTAVLAERFPASLLPPAFLPEGNRYYQPHSQHRLAGLDS